MKMHLKMKILKKKIKDKLNKLYEDKDFLMKIKINYIEICKKKYNVDYYTQSDDYKEKNRKTCLEKYGYEHNGSVPELINKRKKSLNKNKNFNEYTLFKKYKNKVIYETSKNLKLLLNDWDGYDFYDKEYIKDNYNLPYFHKNYPTIDHKISIYEGFKNNISIENISDISNLCITKRWLNSKKGKKSIKKD